MLLQIGGGVMARRLPNYYTKELEPDVQKVVETIIYIVENYSNPSQYDIVKAIFLADRSHLNRYGRPITFDNYVAMIHGPVPTLAYDLVKPDFDFSEYFDEPRPWVSVPDGGHNKFIGVNRSADLSVFSASDLSELNIAIEFVQRRSFADIRRLTHEDPAYLKAWQNRGSAQAADMELELLLEEPDASFADDLKYISRHS